MIRNRCDKVRDEVQLAIEEAHVKLGDLLTDFLDEIDLYEIECQKQYKQVQQNKAQIYSVLNEGNEFRERSESFLKQFQVNEHEINAFLNEARQVLTNLVSVNDKLYFDMFNGELLKFRKTFHGLEAKSLVEIKRLELELHFLENINNLNSIDIRSILNDIDLTMNINVCMIENKSLICSYQNRNKNVNLILFDREGNVKGERKNLITNLKFEEFFSDTTPLIHTSDNVFYVESLENHSDKMRITQRLRSFDENLNFIPKLSIHNFTHVADSFRGILFVFDCEDHGHTSLTVYNSKFESIQKFGQSEENLPFFFPNLIDDSLITD